VVARDHPDLAGRLDPDLRRTEHVPGAMGRHRGVSERQRLTEVMAADDRRAKSQLSIHTGGQ
jgi:hypothetical protein